MLVAALTLGSLVVSATAATQAPFPNPVDPIHLFPQNTQISSGCSTSGPTSCHNTTKESNLCCFESPGVGCNGCLKRNKAEYSCIGSTPSSPVLGYGPPYWTVGQLDDSRYAI